MTILVIFRTILGSLGRFFGFFSDHFWGCLVPFLGILGTFLGFFRTKFVWSQFFGQNQYLVCAEKWKGNILSNQHEIWIIIFHDIWTNLKNGIFALNRFNGKWAYFLYLEACIPTTVSVSIKTTCEFRFLLFFWNIVLMFLDRDIGWFKWFNCTVQHTLEIVAPTQYLAVMRKKYYLIYKLYVHQTILPKLSHIYCLNHFGTEKNDIHILKLVATRYDS